MKLAGHGAVDRGTTDGIRCGFEVDEIDRLTSYLQIGERPGRKGMKVSR